MTGPLSEPLRTRQERAQKPIAGTPAYSRFVNRRLGRWLAGLAFRAGRTPDQVSIASGLCSLAGIATVALAGPAWWIGLPVGFLLVAGYALDSADGQLARLRGGGSPLGEWLDHMIDIAKTVLLHTAVLVWAHRTVVEAAGGPAAIQLVPLGYLFVAVVMFFGLVLVDQLRRAAVAAGGGAASGSGNPRGASVLASLLILPTDYGLVCLSLFTLGWPRVFLVLYAALGLANLVFLIAALAKWRRDLRALAVAAQPGPS